MLHSENLTFSTASLTSYVTAAQADLTIPSMLQETELLAAGFPCVDVSRQGLRQGMMGKVRMLTLIDEYSCACQSRGGELYQVLAVCPMLQGQMWVC